MLRTFIILFSCLLMAVGGPAQTQVTNAAHLLHSWPSIRQFSLNEMDPQLVEIGGRPSGERKEDTALAEGVQRSLLIGLNH